jgi:hypothetical protein
MESNNEGEEDNDEDEDSKDDEEEDDNDLIRYMSDTSDEVLKGQESSDINNVEREEKPQIDGIPNKSDWGDLPPCTHKSTWGNNLTNKSTKRSWKDENTDLRDKQRDERSNSPSNVHYRVTYCDQCDKPGITETLNGKMRCHGCRMQQLRDQAEADQHKDDDDDDTPYSNEESKKEEEKEEDSTTDIPPQTPPRRMKQAATHILQLLKWEQATEGIIKNGRNRPALLHPNYYSLLQGDGGEIDSTQTKRVGVRPELLEYGRSLLHRHNKYKGLHLTQNATKISTSDDDKKVKKKSKWDRSTQTNDITPPTTPPPETQTDSDSSTTIRRKCFQAGEPCASNAEAAERHTKRRKENEEKGQAKEKATATVTNVTGTTANGQ